MHAKSSTVGAHTPVISKLTDHEINLIRKIGNLPPSARKLVLCLAELLEQGYYKAADAMLEQLKEEVAALEAEHKQLRGEVA